VDYFHAFGYKKKYKMARCLCKTMNALLAAGHFDWHTRFGERCTL